MKHIDFYDQNQALRVGFVIKVYTRKGKYQGLFLVRDTLSNVHRISLDQIRDLEPLT
uniref:Uncharacterized protein n=1 Tax=viral metagenome TaxID=1070528 RepID=A0A6M3LQQ5_9ZZZZ